MILLRLLCSHWSPLSEFPSPCSPYVPAESKKIYSQQILMWNTYFEIHFLLFANVEPVDAAVPSNVQMFLRTAADDEEDTPFFQRTLSLIFCPTDKDPNCRVNFRSTFVSHSVCAEMMNWRTFSHILRIFTLCRPRRQADHLGSLSEKSLKFVIFTKHIKYYFAKSWII